MPETMNLNVRVSGSLKDFVNREIHSGSYENISEYVRDLIRRDKARYEEAQFQTLKAELQKAFAAPRNNFIEVSKASYLKQKRKLAK